MKISVGILVVAAGVVAASSAHAAGRYDSRMVNCNDTTHFCDARDEMVAEDLVKRPFSTDKDLQKIYRVKARPTPTGGAVLVVDTQREVSRPSSVNQTVVVRDLPVADQVKWAYRTKQADSGE